MIADEMKQDGRVLLGTIRTTSGTIIILDFGYLNLWCHRDPPYVPDGIFSTEQTNICNQAIDLEIQGQDAVKAGKLFNRQWNPYYLYDIPDYAIEDVEQAFREITNTHKLDAKLTPLGARISHRDRVDRALDYGSGMGEIQIHGIGSIVVEGLPQSRDLPVYAVPMQEPTWADRWHCVIFEIREGNVPERTVKIGDIGVDHARLMISDVEALAEWEHDETLDGLADFVFWGRDADVVATKFQAPKLEDNSFGWVNIAENKALALGRQALDYKHEAELLFATDYRPHSHHYQILKQIWSSELEAGQIGLGDCRSVGFTTSWGDGIFPVYAELGKEGCIQRIRIELGTKQIVQRTEQLNS